MNRAWATQDPRPRTARLLAQARAHRAFDIGFPGAADITYPDLGEFLTRQMLNNVGSPTDPGHGRNHTKDIEREVVDIVADLVAAPDTRWGYVTGGASEGTLHALLQGRRELKDPRVYTSIAAHYSVAKAADLLGLPLTYIPTHPDGRMDVDDLAIIMRRHRRESAVVVATCGTTMSEAIDDVAAIAEVCGRSKVAWRLHVDAALSGIPLALLPDDQRPAFDFAAGATSMVFSGHKFLSTLEPCGIQIYATPPATVSERIAYTGSADSTITGSRSGHAPLRLYSSLTRFGPDGHRQRAEAARSLAAYTAQRLGEIGWPHSRNPHAFTVVLRRPPQVVLDKWVLAHNDEHAHIVTMPGVTQGQIDDFIDDLHTAPAPVIPRQSRGAFRLRAST